MLTHEQVWAAIEALAERHGLGMSGLARKSGLDPTTFNRSKRVGADGRLRWPSTESLAKILDATGVTLDGFMGLLRMPEQAGRDRPASGFFDAPSDAPQPALRPASPAWARGAAFPQTGKGPVSVFEVLGEQFLPVYRPGAFLVTSSTSRQKPGDRLVIRRGDGGLMLRQLVARSRERTTLTGWGSGMSDCVLAPAEITWSARIVWASQ